jgi:hypothetical protein
MEEEKYLYCDWVRMEWSTPYKQFLKKKTLKLGID